MKISIIMPSYNQANFVEAAISSIITQDYKDWELIFLDGGSTDDTMKRIEPYRKHMAHCESGPDKGQSDAFRKGFEMASGDLLTWLNTDDLLLPGALTRVAEAANSDPKCEWFLGNVIWIDSEDRILAARRGEEYSKFLTRLGLFTACGPTTFFSPRLYREIGGINIDLHYKMDTELWWRFLANGTRFKRIDGYIWALRLHSAAKTSARLFLNKIDTKAQCTAKEQAKEAAIVAELVEAHHSMPIRLSITQPFARILRTISTTYLISRLDSIRFKGSSVDQIFN